MTLRAAEVPLGERVPEMVRAVLPPTVSSAVTDPRDAAHRALPDELIALPCAGERRLRDFNAGRVAARRAMAQLGTEAHAILVGAGGMPTWPAGVVGSIAHCQTACAAAVGHRKDWRSIGIDLEDKAALDPELIPSVCTSAEQIWLATQPDAGLMAMVIFSAKESAYKCQYPVSGELIGFEAFDIVFDTPGRFSARFTHRVGGFSKGSELAGRYAIANDLIMTSVVLAPT